MTTHGTTGRANLAKPLVILAYPKIDHEDDYVYHWMPFSLLTVAKPLIERDLADVVIFDGNQSQDHHQWASFLDEHLDRALCIGVSIMTGGGQIGYALNMVREAKRRDHCPPVVFGGPHVNVLGRQTARHDLVDAVLVGPGQNSMPAFVEACMEKCGWSDVPGLISRRDRRTIEGPENPPRTGDMGRYPWHLLNVEEYIRDDPTIGRRTLNYVSSQGCVYKCQFCYELTYRRKYSSIAAAPLVEDVFALQEAYAINGIKFYDADWFVNLRRAETFCDALIRRESGIRWAASINPNDILKARRAKIPLLEKIAASDGTRLLMGIESGNDRVLSEIVKKDVTRSQIIDIVTDIAANGILGAYTFIVGFPGESQEEQEDTYQLIEEIRTVRPTPETRVHLFAPYPGTPLFEQAVGYGFQPPSDLEGWSHYNYYQSQTPWTSDETAARARANTHMRLSPSTKSQVN